MFVWWSRLRSLTWRSHRLDQALHTSNGLGVVQGNIDAGHHVVRKFRQWNDAACGLTLRLRCGGGGCVCSRVCGARCWTCSSR